MWFDGKSFLIITNKEKNMEDIEYQVEINRENVSSNEEEYNQAIGDMKGTIPFSIEGQLY